MKLLDTDSQGYKKLKAHLKVFDNCIVIYDTRHGDRVSDDDLKAAGDIVMPKLKELPYKAEMWVTQRDVFIRIKTATTCASYMLTYMRSEPWTSQDRGTKKTFAIMDPYSCASAAPFPLRLATFCKTFVKKALDKLISAGETIVLQEVAIEVIKDCEARLGDSSCTSDPHMVTYLGQTTQGLRCIIDLCLLMRGEVDDFTTETFENLQLISTTKYYKEGTMHILNDMAVSVTANPDALTLIQKTFLSQSSFCQIAPKVADFKMNLATFKMSSSEGRADTLEHLSTLIGTFRDLQESAMELRATDIFSSSFKRYDSEFKVALKSEVEQLVHIPSSEVDASIGTRVSNLSRILEKASIELPFETDIGMWLGELAGIMRHLKKAESFAKFDEALNVAARTDVTENIDTAAAAAIVAAPSMLGGKKLDKDTKAKTVIIIKKLCERAVRFFPAVDHIMPAAVALAGILGDESPPESILLLKVAEALDFQKTLAEAERIIYAVVENTLEKRVDPDKVAKAKSLVVKLMRHSDKMREFIDKHVVGGLLPAPPAIDMGHEIVAGTYDHTFAAVLARYCTRGEEVMTEVRRGVADSQKRKLKKKTQPVQASAYGGADGHDLFGTMTVADSADWKSVFAFCKRSLLS